KSLTAARAPAARSSSSPSATKKFEKPTASAERLAAQPAAIASPRYAPNRATVGSASNEGRNTRRSVGEPLSRQAASQPSSSAVPVTRRQTTSSRSGRASGTGSREIQSASNSGSNPSGARSRAAKLSLIDQGAGSSDRRSRSAAS